MAAKRGLVALVLMAGACGLLPTLSGSRPDHPERQLLAGQQRVRQRLHARELSDAAGPPA